MAFADLNAVAAHLRQSARKYTLLFGYNGTGKTRLSMAFKDAGKQTPGDCGDTLYFNAYTEDLFTWDNDLDGGCQRVLRFNASFRFFSGLKEREMEDRIRVLLHRYADFDFSIDHKQEHIRISREAKGRTVDFIKISRGEESLFIWCFFLTAAQLALGGVEAYGWVKYLYIDDPVSSLDENNVVAVAVHLKQLLKAQGGGVKTLISTHHTRFYNVFYNEMKTATRCFLERDGSRYILRNTEDKPFFHHAASLAELVRAGKSGRLYTYHFNMLRSVLEKTANFHPSRSSPPACGRTRTTARASCTPG